METNLFTAALIRRDNEILLVEQQAPHDPNSNWALPGGRVEEGELVHDGLMREVLEETGLIVQEIGQVIYICHIVDRQRRWQSLVIAHEVTAWDGQLGINDPDELILTVKFCPRDEAVELVGRGIDYAPMRDPIVAYLRGDVSAGATWLYEWLDGETIELVTQIGD